MSTEGDMPIGTRQATEAGALGEKDANCCPAEMAPNQEVLGPEQGLLSL